MSAFARSVPLAPEHSLDTFNSGVPVLDGWLTDHARDAARRRTATTFVWVHENFVVAYYSLAAHAVVKALLPIHVGRGSPDPAPALPLAKFALDQRLQRKGLGSALMFDALDRVVRTSDHGAAARFVLVDALTQETAAFYRKLGFVDVPNKPRQLVLKVSNAAASVEAHRADAAALRLDFE